MSWTYEQSRDNMLKSSYNKLYSEVEHNHPLIIKTACIVSYDKNDRNKILSATLVQSGFPEDESCRIILPPGYELPWQNANPSLIKALDYAIKSLEKEIEELDSALETKDYAPLQQQVLEEKLNDLKADLKEFRSISF